MATWTVLTMQYENNASQDKLVVISAAQGQDGDPSSSLLPG